MTEYRTIAGYSHYRFGSDGSVWSNSPNVRGTERDGQWVRLPGTIRRTGHVIFVLRDDDRNPLGRQCGQWILIAFVGPKPKGKGALHWDGNPKNNALSNLRWGTQQENTDDSKRHGTMAKGEKIGTCKITEQLALVVRKMSAARMNNIDIGNRVGLDPSVICRIVRGERWQHIGGPVRKRDNRFGATNVYGRVVRVCGCGKRCKGPSYFNHANVCPHAPADPNDAIVDRADFERRLGKCVQVEQVA